MLPAMNARRVGPGEIEPLHAIVAACGLDMQRRLGLSHWVPPHPLDRMRDDARERSVFALEQDGAIVGTFTVGASAQASYPPGMWRGAEPALYLNRLAILPSLQGRGLGKLGMAAVEAEARRGGFRSLRFDAIAGNEPLLAFYRRLGYEERGETRIGCGAVICFERAT